MILFCFRFVCDVRRATFLDVVEKGIERSFSHKKGAMMRTIRWHVGTHYEYVVRYPVRYLYPFPDCL